MLNRPTRVQTYMDIAAIWAKRSTCMRRNVGAVIVRDRHIIGHGYNGTPPDQPHCMGNDCPGRHVCSLTTHAEENAIKHTEYVGNHLDADIFTTDSPCLKCARLIRESGIKRVFFATPYRVTEPLLWLLDSGVSVYQVMPAGYVIDYATRDLVEVEL